LKSKFLVAVLASFCFITIGFASQKPPEATEPEIGIHVGQTIPRFTASDQFGNEVSSESLKGPNGTILLFFRSADW
jgi:cytochrome oxidase Cu insertion factor (SCO1/SenC/PrrC family)